MPRVGYHSPHKRLADAYRCQPATTHASAQVQPDAAKHKPLYSRINDFLLDQCFVNVLAPNAPLVITRANVNGVRWTMHESRVYADIWLA